MILFTSGLPCSGKTTLVKKLIKKLDNKLILHINPKDYYTNESNEFNKLDKEEQTEISILAWEMSLEKASKSICALPNKVLIIFDTCCSKALHMRPLFVNSKLCGHDIFLIYVNADLKSRLAWASPHDEIVKLELRYRKDFLKTLPILKQLADDFMVCANIENQFDKCIQDLTDKIKSTREEIVYGTTY